MVSDEGGFLDTRRAAANLGLSQRTLDGYCVSRRGPTYHRFGIRLHPSHVPRKASGTATQANSRLRFHEVHGRRRPIQGLRGRRTEGKVLIQRSVVVQFRQSMFTACSVAAIRAALIVRRNSHPLRDLSLRGKAPCTARVPQCSEVSPFGGQAVTANRRADFLPCARVGSMV